MEEGVLDSDYGYGKGVMRLKFLECKNYPLENKKFMLKNCG